MLPLYFVQIAFLLTKLFQIEIDAVIYTDQFTCYIGTWTKQRMVRSPCDFFLFPRIKKMLSGNKYTSRSSLGSAIYLCLQQIPKEDYLSAFHDWVKRLQKCVSVKGEYSEGL